MLSTPARERHCGKSPHWARARPRRTTALCSQVVLEIGITSTPVIDPQSGPNGTIYAVAMSKDGSGTYHQRLHALNLSTGAEEFGGPVRNDATLSGFRQEGSGGTQTFDPKQHVERAALAIANGVVFTSWSSHCDNTPYTSWVIGYDEATMKQTTVLNLTPNGDEGGLWQAGAGPAVDAAGNLYVLMGNGTFDVSLNSTWFPAAITAMDLYDLPGNHRRGRLFHDVQRSRNLNADQIWDREARCFALVERPCSKCHLPVVGRQRREPVCGRPQ